MLEPLYNAWNLKQRDKKTYGTSTARNTVHCYLPNAPRFIQPRLKHVTNGTQLRMSLMGITVSTNANMQAAAREIRRGRINGKRASWPALAPHSAALGRIHVCGRLRRIRSGRDSEIGANQYICRPSLPRAQPQLLTTACARDATAVV